MSNLAKAGRKSAQPSSCVNFSQGKLASRKNFAKFGKNAKMILPCRRVAARSSIKLNNICADVQTTKTRRRLRIED
jgi:hypothetical protein